uniref:CSON007072 protein n=1 Tax=Culicoides sonorensis TaxID=179676 RepID=A0A336LX31_CULSO
MHTVPVYELFIKKKKNQNILLLRYGSNLREKIQDKKKEEKSVFNTLSLIQILKSKKIIIIVLKKINNNKKNLKILINQSKRPINTKNY